MPPPRKTLPGTVVGLPLRAFAIGVVLLLGFSTVISAFRMARQAPSLNEGGPTVLVLPFWHLGEKPSFDEEWLPQVPFASAVSAPGWLKVGLWVTLRTLFEGVDRVNVFTFLLPRLTDLDGDIKRDIQIWMDDGKALCQSAERVHWRELSMVAYAREQQADQLWFGTYRRQGAGVRVTIVSVDVHAGSMQGCRTIESRLDSLQSAVSATGRRMLAEAGIDPKPDAKPEVPIPVEVWKDYSEAVYSGHVAQAAGFETAKGTASLAHGIAAARRAVDRAPNFPPGWEVLGWRLSLREEDALSIQAFERAIALSPSEGSHRGLGQALLRRGRYEEAIGQFQAALRLRPGREVDKRSLLTALQLHGRDADAVQLARELLTSRDAGTRRAALNAMARLGGPQAEALIDKFAEDEDEGVRRRAAQLALLRDYRRRGPQPPTLVVSPRVGGLWQLAFSGDGEIFTSATDNNTVGIWNTRGGRLLRQIPLTGRVALSPDGSVVAVNESLSYGGWHPVVDSTITLWSTADGSLRQILDVGAQADSLEFSQDGGLLAVSDRRSGVAVYDVRTGVQVASISHRQLLNLAGAAAADPSTTEAVESDTTASFDGSGRALLVYGDIEGEYFSGVWDLREHRFRWSDRQPARFGRFAPDGALVVTAHREGFIARNATTGRTLWRKPPLDSTPGNVYFRFTRDSSVVFAWSSSAEAAWRSDNGEAVAAPDGPFAETGAAFHTSGFTRTRVLTPDGRHWLTHEDKGWHSQLLDRTSGQTLWPEATRSLDVWNVQMAASGTLDVIGWNNDDLVRWSWQYSTGAATPLVRIDTVPRNAWGETCEGLIGIAVSSSLNEIAVSKGPCVRTYSLQERRQIGAFQLERNIDALEFSPDGSTLAVGTESRLNKVVRRTRSTAGPEIGRIELRSIRDGHLIREFRGHQERSVQSLVFSPDGRHLASGTFSEVHLWDVLSGELVESYPDLEAPVLFDRAGANIITGPGVRVTNLRQIAGQSTVPATSRSLDVGRTECGPGGGTFSLSESGALLAFSCPGSRGEPIQVWDLESEKLVGRLTDDQLDFGYGHAGAFSADARHVFAKTDSGITIWRNPAGGSSTESIESTRPMATLATFADGGWAIVDERGRFDTNNLDGSQTVHWVLPDDPLTPAPVELFLREYYEPRLYSKLLDGAPLRPVKDVLSLNRVQPHVRISRIMPNTDTPGEVDVVVQVGRAEVRKVSHGQDIVISTAVHDLRLFRDGQLVGVAPPGSGQISLDSATGTAEVTFPRIRLPRRSGLERLEFSAYAFNDDRIKSATSRMSFSLPTEAPKDRGRAFIIAVGVDTYENPAANLLYAANDARLVGSELADRLKGSYSFVTSVVLTSSAGDAEGKRVTKAHLQAVLGQLRGDTSASLEVVAPDLTRAGPDDLVVLFIASHGHADQNGDFYLFLADSDPVAVSDEARGKAVSSKELSDWLTGVDAGDLVLVLDACHGAAAVEGEGFKPGPMGSAGLGQLAYDKGMRVLAATQASDVALELDALRHGLLTYALVRDGLQSGEADFSPGDGQLTLSEWLQYGEARVPVLHRALAQSENRSTDQGRGLVRRPATQSPTVVPTQQPKLFDFRRTGVPITLVIGQTRTP
jgi:WD40 repeat protein